MAEYKLIYFNGKGLGELSRFIFTAADVPFEDCRIEFKDWPALKPTMPFGQLPVLEIKEDGKTHFISQSKSIARFLANRFNLAGANDIEKAKADMVCDQLADLHSHFQRAYFNQPDEETKKKALEEFACESGKLLSYMESLEKLLANCGTEFFAGNTMTFADFNVAIFFDRFEKLLGSNADKFPLIKALSDKVNKSPKIAAYIAKRPITSF